MPSPDPAQATVPTITSRRDLLGRATMLGGVAAAAATGLLPGVAEACHTIPKSKGGCMTGSSSSGGSKPSGGGSSSSSSSSSGGSSWSGPIGTGDIGRDPYSFFGTGNRSWAIDKHFAIKGGSPRTAIGRAPDGRPSVQMNIPQGINWNNQFQSAPFGSRGLDAAVLSVDIYLQSGFDWGNSGGKFAFGFWGGTGDVGGGVPVSQQRGFSIRNVRGNDRNDTGVKLYSYHLNRSSGNFGQTSSGKSAPLAKGRWVNVQLELHLNTVGSNNGYALLRVDGRQVADMRGLNYRRDNSVGIRGLLWNDMWGGNEQDRVNWSPKSQKMWYSNYRISRV